MNSTIGRVRRAGRVAAVAASLAACGTESATIEGPSSAAPDPGYQAYITGAGPDVMTTGGQRAVYLGGGGTDDEAGMQWLLAQGGRTASGRYGDVVILRTSGRDGYNALLDRLGASSVTTFVIANRDGANNPAVAAALSRAEVVFIAGGDQSTYVNLWIGTALQTAVNARIAAGAAIGGTSAGLNAVGHYIYSAQNVSTTSAMALGNPYDPSITFASERLFAVPQLDNTIAEPHFVIRDRLGRFYTFLRRLQADNLAGAPRGMALDEDSGVGLGADGAGRVFGAGKGAYLFTTTASGAGRLAAPLAGPTIAVLRVPVGGTFDARSWSGQPNAYTVWAMNGAIVSSTGALY